MPIIFTIGADDDEYESVCIGWIDFDVAQCHCYNEEDKVRIFVVAVRFEVQNFND